MKKKFMKGKMIEPLKLVKNISVKEFIDKVFANSSYNARKLSRACEIFSRMVNSNATICLTLAGAMTPIGMSGPIIKMMENGFLDFIISTGANIYHDLHRAYNAPVVQGSSNVDDEELHKYGIARIYDVFIEDSETLTPTDKVIVETAEKMDPNRPVSTSEFHKILGENVLKTAPHPEKSFLAMAAKFKVPVYTSSPGDSSVAMNLAVPYVFDHKIIFDPVLDIIETTAIVWNSKKNGVIIVGGGSPKNFYLQTQPTLWQMFMDNSKGGHDYFIQLTTDSPQWGGLSGATPQEATSWGKVKNAEVNSVVVYSCASITFPLLCQYALSAFRKRKRKELYNRLKELKEKFISYEIKNPKFIQSIRKYTSSETYKKIYKKYLG